MPGSDGFSVEPAALDLLRSQLSDVVSGMAAIGPVSAGYGPLDLGPDAGLWNALQSFDSAWSYGLSLIRGNAGSLLPKLAVVTENYRTAEMHSGGTAIPGNGTSG